ncbi:MAG: hypothetical protein K2J60_03620 [Acetatifactor sp.]|nr:hypothetical protein [Acetatifactor sp.]
MKDLMEMSYEILKTVKGDLEQRKTFVEQFLQEIAKEESADIAPHFTCSFDVIKREYVVTLKIPTAIDKFHSGGGDPKKEETEDGVAMTQPQNSKTNNTLTDNEKIKCTVKWLNTLYRAWPTGEGVVIPCGECKYHQSDFNEDVPPPANN